MKYAWVCGLLIGVLLMMALLPAGYGRERSSSSRERLSRIAAVDSPQLTGLQLLFRGKQVEHIVSGNKVKKYSIELTGTGFVPGSSMTVDSLQAFPSILDNPRQPVAVTYNSATSLSVHFVKGSGPSPGLLSVQVVNPDGERSNRLSFDVVSNPSDLSITSIVPPSGPIGTQVTLRGVGFDPPSSSNGAAIRFTRVSVDSSGERFDMRSTFVGFYTALPQDPGAIVFSVPIGTIAPLCAGGHFTCDPFASMATTPGQYRVQVINPHGISDSVIFEVTSATARY